MIVYNDEHHRIHGSLTAECGFGFCSLFGRMSTLPAMYVLWTHRMVFIRLDVYKYHTARIPQNVMLSKIHTLNNGRGKRYHTACIRKPDERILCNLTVLRSDLLVTKASSWKMLLSKLSNKSHVRFSEMDKKNKAECPVKVDINALSWILRQSCWIHS